MPLSTLIGNERAKSALDRMVLQKTVPHALLFHGQEGVGKSLFALGLAKLLMGMPHFKKLESGNHPDLYTYLPEGKGALHTMETVQKMINETALVPYEAPCKVFIIRDAHHMLPYSSNALLKTIEEPPPYCYFILLTGSLDSMLPTLGSRCRKIPFFPIPQAEIESLIKDTWKKKPEEARRIAFFSHGSLAKAEQLVKSIQPAWRHSLLEILSLNLPSDYYQLQKLIAKIEEENSEENTSFLDPIFEEIVAWYRDLHILKEKIAPEYLYHLDSIDRLKLTLSKPLPPMEKILSRIGKARLYAQRHIRLATILEDFFLQT